MRAEEPMDEVATTLYRRLGGYDVIAQVIDDMLLAFQADPDFGRFGTGRSVDSRARSRQLLVDQICQLSGGPCLYVGRDMRTSHAGLGITEEEWATGMRHTEGALVANDVPERERTEFLALFERYRSDIVDHA